MKPTTTKTNTPIKPATSTKRVRGPLVKTPITAADALPGVVLLPAGINEPDPVKAMPLIIERLNGMQAEAERLRGELAAKQSEYNTAEAYLKTVRAALDCNDDAQLAERAQKLQDALAKAQKLQDDLSTTRTRLTASEREVFDLKLQIDSARLATTEANGISNSHSARADRLEGEMGQLETTLKGMRDSLSEAESAMDICLQDLSDIQAREAAILGMFKTFDAGTEKTPPTAINLVASVNSLFLARNNARSSWETAQNNVNRLRAENERWESILGGLFTKLQSVYPETAEYRDMEGAVARLIDTTKSSLSEVDEATDFAGKWQGRAYFIGALLTAASLYIALHLIGVVK